MRKFLSLLLIGVVLSQSYLAAATILVRAENKSEVNRNILPAIQKPKELFDDDGNLLPLERLSIEKEYTEGELSNYDDQKQYRWEEQCGTFDDVATNAKLCVYLRTARKLGVVASNSQFHPNRPIPRKQFLALLVRGLQIEMPADCELSQFDDVKEDNVFYDEILTGRCTEIVYGVDMPNDETYFFGNKLVRRVGAIAMTIRALEYIGVEIPDTDNVDLTEAFKDGDLDGDDTFTDVVEKMSRINKVAPEPIITGYSDGYLRPMKPLTRLEAVVIVVRAMRAAGIVDDLVIEEFFDEVDDHGNGGSGTGSYLEDDEDEDETETGSYLED